MSDDERNQRLADWLQGLGCPIQLTPDDLQRLNTPSWRSIWNHLQRHIMTVRSVQTIKKNLLLSKFRKEGILPGEFGIFRIESVQELADIQKMSKIQREINNLKCDLKTINETLQSVTYTLAAKVTENNYLKCDIKDVEVKTSLLKRKLSEMQKDINKLDLDIDISSCLRICHSPMSYSEISRNKNLIAHHIESCKFSSLGTLSNNDYISDIIESSLGIPVNIIFDGILLSSKTALMSLSHCKANLDADVISIKEKLATRGVLSFSKHLNNLKSQVVQNELKMEKCLQKIREHSVELEKEKLLLLNSLQELKGDNSATIKNDDGEEITVKKFVDMVIGNCTMLAEGQKIMDLKDELETGCLEFDHLNWQVISFGEKERKLRKTVDIKISDINKLVAMICDSKVYDVKAESLRKCTAIASDFLTDLKLKDGDNVDSLLASEMMREVGIVQRASLTALLGKWRERNEMLSKDVATNPSLHGQIVHLKPKDILNSALEEMCWSQSLHR